MPGAALSERTVGVLERDDARMQRGLTLFSAGRETYLIDEDGRVVQEWRSSRVNFCAYLLPSGNLLRDGNDNIEAPCFKAGGAAGIVEEVTWDNEPVWSFASGPYTQYLTHHDLEPMPNGNVLVLRWERKSKEEAASAGRRPDLMPDGEVWNDTILELKPNGKGGADIVWKWSFWDHLVQDYDPDKKNFGDVAASPQLFDINYCPPGGKTAARNRDLLTETKEKKVLGLEAFGAGPGNPSGKTGEKDWLHINALSYDAVRDQVLLSVNIASEVLILDHSTTTDEASGHTGGNGGKGGDILYRLGNPQVARLGSRVDQSLFNQHAAQFLRGVPGDGNVLLFNNGRCPDRFWSSAEEYRLPAEASGEYEVAYASSARQLRVWSYGPAAGRRCSFYCTHISGCQRLPNGNTLVTMGPQGILFEVTPGGDEVWRYVNPVRTLEGSVAVARQGEQRVAGVFSMFYSRRYAPEHPAFMAADGKPRVLTPGRHLEA